MRSIFGFLSFTLPLLSAFTEIIPTAPGMTWQYNLTQEVGEGVRFSDLKPDPDGKFRAAVMYRIDGRQQVDSKDLLKFEMHRDGVVTNTDLITINERGIICSARIGVDGELIRLEPPQTMVAAPLKIGANWDFDSEVAGEKIHQHYNITGEEDVSVPAGKFRAFHIHGEQTSPGSMTIDRWFVNGTGIVKDVTATKSADGKLVRRISLDLKEKPKIATRPEVKLTETLKKLSVAIGKDPVGAAVTQFASRTPNIYARWQGHGLRHQAKIRIVWIAENMGNIAPPDYTIDEATATATAPNSHGIFTLSRPGDGWAPGDYRVEFYVDGTLVESVKVKIVQ